MSIEDSSEHVGKIFAVHCIFEVTWYGAQVYIVLIFSKVCKVEVLPLYRS
jgi:hypothetical protein